METSMQRRHLMITAAGSCLGLPTLLHAQAVEKPKTTIAVGGKNLLYYLPLTIAEQRGYFKAEGLDVTIVDFAGGARALQALVGGSADVVSGAFEHTVNMQVKGQRLRAFALQGRAPQIVLGLNPKTMAGYKVPADLKGKKIGVTAPGSSTNVMVNFFLAKAGLKPSDVSIIGVGASQGAVAAMRSGQIDAISNLDPVITLLQRSGDLKIISDTRILAEADKVFGGPMPAGCQGCRARQRALGSVSAQIPPGPSQPGRDAAKDLLNQPWDKLALAPWAYNAGHRITRRCAICRQFCRYQHGTNAVNRSMNRDLWTVGRKDGAAVGRAGRPAGADRRRRTGGFTLLELLVVVTIIGLLAAYVGPKYFSQLGKSEQGVAKAQIEAFARALDTYRLDVGFYPTTEEGLNALLTRPATAAKWNGPYLQKAVPLDP